MAEKWRGQILFSGKIRKLPLNRKTIKKKKIKKILLLKFHYLKEYQLSYIQWPSPLPKFRIKNFQEEDKSAYISPHNVRGGPRTVEDLVSFIKIIRRNGAICWLLKTSLVILGNKIESKLKWIILQSFEGSEIDQSHIAIVLNERHHKRSPWSCLSIIVSCLSWSREGNTEPN